MCPIDDGISRLSTFGGVAALVAAAALVAWIIGLLIVLRGSKADQRSEIIYAYAHCHPLGYLRRNTAPRSNQHLAHAKGGITDSDGETDHKGVA
jgi:hypothetical protein